jgi:hypothetical protein
VEPYWVDGQGLFFDTAAKRLLANYDFNTGWNLNDIHSFSVEVWLRFNYTAAGGMQNNMYVVQKKNGAHYFAMLFSSVPEV